MSINPFRVRSLPRAALVLAVAALGALFVSSSAQAACSYPQAEQVFSRWSDNAYYELAPDGGLEEGGSGWTFSGGAGLVAANESQFLNGSGDHTALRLPYGGTAISPRVCVDSTTPSFRLMAVNSGDASAKLRVVVTYESVKQAKSRTIEFRGASSWSPTESLQLDTDGESERVARISFTPRDRSGSWLVDDLYIDPFARR